MDEYYDDFLEQSVIEDEIEEIDDYEVNGDENTSITSYKNDTFEIPSIDSNHDSSLYKNDFYDFFESDENTMLPIDNLIITKDIDGTTPEKNSIDIKSSKKKKKHGSPTNGISPEVISNTNVNKINKPPFLGKSKVMTSIKAEDGYKMNVNQSISSNKAKKVIHAKDNRNHKLPSSANSNIRNHHMHINNNDGINNKPSHMNVNNRDGDIQISQLQSNTKPIIHHAPGILYKQLAIAMNQVNLYRKENEILQHKLDIVGIDEAIMKYKTLLIEKENKIITLLSENHALKEIARYQAKYLETNKNKTEEPEKYILSQENQIEILMVHIKKLKEKLSTMKVNQDQLLIDNELIKKRNNRLICSNNKIRRKLRQFHPPSTAINNTNDTSYPSSAVHNMIDPEDESEKIIVDKKEGIKHKPEIHDSKLTKQPMITPTTVLAKNMKAIKDQEDAQNQIISNDAIQNILLKEEVKTLNKNLKDLNKRYNDEIYEYKQKLNVACEERESFKEKLYQSEEKLIKARDELDNVIEEHRRANYQKSLRRESLEGHGYNGRINLHLPNHIRAIPPAGAGSTMITSNLDENPMDDTNTLQSMTSDLMNNNNNNIASQITNIIPTGNKPQPPPIEQPVKKTIRSIRGTIYSIKLT